MNYLVYLGSRLATRMLTLGIQIDGVETKSVDEFSQALVQIFLVIRNISLVIALVFGAFQVIKFIIADGQEKMQHAKTIALTILGVVLIVLLPSLINFIVSFFS